MDKMQVKKGRVHIDFEKAAINAVSSTLVEYINIKGGFYENVRKTTLNND